MRPIAPTLALLGLLAGCTVGPNYAGPPKSATQTTAFARAGDAASATAPVARWWEALGDPVLNDLVARTLAANPNVAAAQARLRQARAALRVERANELPNISGTGSYAHAHLPGIDFGSSDNGGSGNSGGGSTDLDVYNVGFDASWEIDIFGGQRRAIQAARATAEVAEANIADTQVSLSAEVVQAYVNLRDRQRRINLGNNSIAMQEQMLELTRQRLGRGTASQLDVTRLENQLDNSRAEITPLHAEAEAYLDELATLTGQAPGALDATLTPVKPLPLPPAEVAVGDPAALLQRRPDIRAAERTLAADTAKIGQAEAARFPKVSFMGLIGVGGSDISDLTKLDDFVALVAPQISWDFLDFGRNAAKVRQAEGVRDEAEAKYRATVLAALRDAEDSLSRFRYGRITVATRARAKAEADLALQLSEQRYRAGTTTLIDLLDARRQQIAAEQNLSIAEAGLTGDFVAIQKALGLGWAPPA
ncbi:efflux transporter outer membrane subunit [Sphingomonas sp. PR090111-T3T-6A]|uniref:efflux transporter outer membrane subunit n=1 Tax=Sphingomonas sp. PR090111-T3T-6A TaxID=685778 RepID=UPI0003801AB8|nr:efflux transporter outer membrane subunit [Sphingomonas sp. PR090111-T3T-6A]